MFTDPSGHEANYGSNDPDLFLTYTGPEDLGVESDEVMNTIITLPCGGGAGRLAVVGTYNFGKSVVTRLVVKGATTSEFKFGLQLFASKGMNNLRVLKDIKIKGYKVSMDLERGANPQSLNLYAYCSNNPVMYTDPSGHDANYGSNDPDLFLNYTGAEDLGVKSDEVMNTIITLPCGGGAGRLVVVGMADLGKSVVTKLVIKGATTAEFKFDLQLFARKGAQAGFESVDNGIPIGGKLTGYTKHGLNQAIGRDGGRGVASNAILDALKNPIKVISQEGGKYKYVGKDAVVVLNDAGKVVTTYAKSRAGLRGGH